MQEGGDRMERGGKQVNILSTHDHHMSTQYNIMSTHDHHMSTQCNIMSTHYVII